MANEMDKVLNKYGINKGEYINVVTSQDFMEKLEKLRYTNNNFNRIPEGDQKLCLVLSMMKSEKKILRGINKSLYRRPIPTVEEFLSYDHIGDMVRYYPKGKKSIWKDAMKEVFDIRSEIEEVVMTGAIGVAKSSNSMLFHFYNLYRLTSVYHPQFYLDSAANKTAKLQLMSVTKNKAVDTLLAPIRILIRSNKYFKEVKDAKEMKEFIAEPSLKAYTPWYATRETMEFPNNIRIDTGSQEHHTIGEDLFAASLDEVEFRVGYDVQRTFNLYQQIVQRVQSRFKGSKFILYTLVSSSGSDTGVIATYIKNIPEFSNRTKVVKLAIWDVKHTDQLSGEHFWVMRGNRSYPSKFLTEEESELQDRGELQKKPGCEYVKVPIEYKTDFHQNGLELSLRDLAGLYTINDEKPFDDTEHIVDTNLCPEIHLVAPMSSTRPLIDQLPDDAFLSIQGNRRFMRFPDAMRYASFDLAQTGEAGFAVVHKEFYNNNQIIVVDFYGKIYSPDVIRYDSVEKFMVDLVREIGFTFQFISADSYQSAAFIQKCRNEHLSRIEAKVVSVDKRKEGAERYNALSSMVREHRIFVGQDVELRDQLDKIFIDINKEKPYTLDGARKDIADAICAAATNAMWDSSVVSVSSYAEYTNMMQNKGNVSHRIPKNFREI